MLPRSTRSSKVEETEEEKMARARRERRERLKSAVKLGADRLVDGRGQLFAQSVKKKTSIFGAISDLVLGGGTPSKSDVKVATSSEEANAANDYDDIADPAEEGGAVVRERKSTVVLGVGGAEHQGKMNNMKRKTTTNNLRQADSDKNLNANEFARDFLEVMDHCCELEAYLNTWERPSSSNRRRAGQESQGVTKDELNFSSSSDDDDNDGDNGFGLARNLRSRKSGTARPGKSTSSRRQRSSFVQGETAPLLPPPPQPDPFRDEAMKLLRRDEAVAASLRMPHKALFGSSGTTNDGNQYQGSNRENRRNSVSNDDYDNPDNTSSRLSQQSEGGDTTRAAGVSSQDLHLYREKLAVHTKEIARLLDVAGLDQALFSRVRARKREVARWVQVPDYDPNTGMYMPYYLYKDRKEIRYAVPDTPFMRQNFLEHAFEVLEENLQHLAENVTEIALEVVEEPPSSTRAEQKVDKDAVLPSHLGSESSEMKKTLETNNMKNGEATSKIVPRQNVEQGEFDNRNNGPRTSSRPVKKRNLIDRLGAWLSEKRALYETPHVIAEIETLQATATEANLLPQRLFNRVMISLLVSWAVAFATLTYQECQAYVKFLRQPPFQHADSVIQFINDPVTTAQAAAENGDGGAAGQTRIQLGVSGTTIGTAEGAPAVNSAGAAAATTGFVQIEARTADYLRSAGTTVSNVRMAAWGSEKENLAGEVARIACSQKCGRSRVVVATEYDLLNFGDSSQCAREMQSLIVREIEAQIQSPIETAAYGDYSWNGGSSFDYYNGGGGGNGGFPGMGPEMMSYYFGSDYRYNGGDQTISFGTGGGGGSGGARGNTHLTTGRNKIENFKDIIDISLDKDCNPVVLLRNSVVRCVQVGDDSADDVVHRGGAAAAAGAKQAPAKAKARAKQFRAQVLRLIGQWEGYELRPKSIFVNQDTNDIVLGVDDGTRPTLLLMVVVDPVSIGSPPDSQPLLRPTAELFYGLADVLQRYDTYWQDPNRVSIHEDHHARIRLIPEVIFMRKNPLFKGPAKCNKEAPAVLCYYEKHEDQFRYTLHAVTQLQYAMSYSGNGEIEITPNVDLVNACFLEEEDAGKGVILGISSERQIVSYKFADVFV
ncbi:unnamed protein product [Amoebophrya sp. A25]|nr:unnamed protein product [Amoebophrya sp. A25]|eukprot:GSA25T00023870001.1